MKKKEYYSRAETARILGVSEQTVSNYTKSGILPCVTYKVKEKSSLNYPADIVDALVKERVSETFEDIESVKAKIRRERDAYHEQLEMYRAAISSASDATERISPRMKALEAMFDSVMKLPGGNTLTPDEISFVRNSMEGCDLTCFMEKNGWSLSRYKDFSNKTYRKFLYIPKNFIREFNDLREENLRQAREIESLKRKLSETANAETAMPEPENDFVSTLTDEEKEKLLLPVNGLNLSVRTSHCLRYVDIENVAELVYHSRAQLCDIRNMGTKSMKEIDAAVEALGLRYGMTELRSMIPSAKLRSWESFGF